MKKLIVFIALLLCSIVGMAQSKIEGRLANAKTEPLPYVSVVLLSATDSSFAKGGISDVEGKFIIENVQNGKYLLISSYVGYKKRTLSNIDINSKQDLNLGLITLEEETTQLNEVVVTAEKPLFEQQIDRMVMNVENRVSFSGNTVLDILQKSPGIIVDQQNNTINMNGKSGVRVMINGKMMQLPLSVVVQMLNGMSSANVEKIEFITTPPAKYDAEGNGGIIHIVTKQNTDLGTNGSFGITLGYKAKEVYGKNFNIAHRGRNFAYTLNYSLLSTHNVHTMEIMTQGNNRDFIQVKDYSHRDNVTSVQDLSGGIEWNLGKNTSLGLQLTGYRSNWEMNATTNDVNQVKKDSSIITDMNVYEKNLWQSASGALTFQSRLDDKNEINLSIDYLHYHNNNPSRYENNILYLEDNIQGNSFINLSKFTPIKMLIGKADYQYYPSQNTTIESGAKFVTSTLDNDVVVTNLVSNEWVTDNKYTSYSSMNEQVAAAYSSISLKLKNNYHLSGGLRYEYTQTVISTPTERYLINRKYGYFFPSVFFKKDLSKEREIQFSYSRRITRPTYNDIAPFVFFFGPNTFSAGNTSLWPSISDAVQLSYRYQHWITSLQFSHSQREISFFQPEIERGTSNTIYRSQNMRYLNTLSLSTSYSFHIANWWEVQTNLSGRYQIIESSNLPVNIALTVYGINVDLKNMIKLPKDILIEVSGFYQSKTFLGISQRRPLGSINAAVQKKFKRGSSLKLAMDDILYTREWYLKTNIPANNINTNVTYDWHAQYVRLVYTKSFGNNKLKSVHLKSGSEEERGRVNN